ncbi:MAG: hypothetical protein V5B39_06610 [Accumulibacter sp.]|uniref:hypothetical protein n=1 Tax=Accumulibacter sp. TaxID=2053492 RepID=UPI002FC27BED
MPFTANDDINILQASDSLNVGAGPGNDKYILSGLLVAAAGKTINITDPEGNNTLQLINGLTIVSSVVAGSAVQLILSNGVTVNVLGANSFHYEIGGDPLLGTSGVIQDYTAFATTTLGAPSVPTGNATVSINTPVTIGGGGGFTNIPLLVGTSAAVTASAANEAFTFDVAAAKASVANTQIPINGFSATNDKLVIDTLTALGNTTLAALSGVDGIAVQANIITQETLINFGSDANGDVITVELAGITDPSLVHVTII